MRRFLLASAVLLWSVSALAQQDAAAPAMAVMGQQCLMNHPITSKMELTMAMTPKSATATGDAKSTGPKTLAAQPFTTRMSGEMDRDSDGRTRVMMRVPLPNMDKPIAMTIIMDPIEKRMVALNDSKKTYEVSPLDFTGQCTQHVPSTADFEAAFKAAGMTVTRLDDKQIEGYPAVGYSIGFPDKMFGKAAEAMTQKPTMTAWLDPDDDLPLEMQIAMRSDKLDMDLQMKFTDVHRVETPVAAFGVPESYTSADSHSSAGTLPSHKE